MTKVECRRKSLEKGRFRNWEVSMSEGLSMWILKSLQQMKGVVLETVPFRPQFAPSGNEEEWLRILQLSPMWWDRMWFSLIDLKLANFRVKGKHEKSSNKNKVNLFNFSVIGTVWGGLHIRELQEKEFP